MLGRKQPEPKIESPDETQQAVRAGAAFRLTVSFMLVVVIAFLRRARSCG